jgi:hypothetical protein
MSRRRPSTIDAAPAIQRGKPDSSPEQDARRPDTSFPLEAHLGMARYVSAEISICTELHLRVTKYRSLHDTFVPLRELCTEIGDYMPDLIAGKYLVVEGTKARIGGHSSVRKAVDITTGNFYAIKFITGRGDSMTELIFRREVESLKQARHLSVVLRGAGLDRALGSAGHPPPLHGLGLKVHAHRGAGLAAGRAPHPRCS